MFPMVRASLRRFPEKFSASLNVDEHNEIKEMAEGKTKVRREWNPGEYHLPTVWYGMSYLTSLCLGFIICKMGIIIITTSLEGFED